MSGRLTFSGRCQAYGSALPLQQVRGCRDTRGSYPLLGREKRACSLFSSLLRESACLWSFMWLIRMFVCVQKSCRFGGFMKMGMRRPVSPPMVPTEPCRMVGTLPGRGQVRCMATQKNERRKKKKDDSTWG
jgi:hypothetical protein